ncbi:uncharacterized protein LOC126379615 isoform X1 [Pectinophora gossypiella]|nr:uncharacterized protein LOC126379615 isoform X1 [Pectinophora gossypiella]XP_049884396.1 uncharacterized protein LOC126379615 isoform X1 [Pectinophora gossypiella]XP_049884397.1 uncharacterized protein LOC126379615 isoform X1 [Pectinophora gossypiella]XP_049884398.1 uncharacterized protein LOC126379615 isoform X1 [Pectinophora gossypiella]XP_049884399.1 uncharacterized protein LOC126379615 isoform X1 [Pectinophora gossypiella]
MRVFWRVEMWCRRQAAAAILPLLLAGWLMGESSQALTTFGKSNSNTQAPKEVTPTPPPARQCQRQAECAGISGTSCVRTHYDATTRCLCGDNLPPVNGQCENAQTKNLYHICSNSDECNEGLICLQPNITFSTPHLRVYTPQDRICLCDSENGYKEKEHTCNDADILKTSLFAIVVVSCIKKLVY